MHSVLPDLPSGVGGGGRGGGGGGGGGGAGDPAMYSHREES